MSSKWLCILAIVLMNQLALLSAYTPENNEGLDLPLHTIEGDIILTAKQYRAFQKKALRVRNRRAVIMDDIKKWSDGIVPYELSPSLSTNAVTAIMDAMNDIMSNSCVKFRSIDSADLDYIYFFPGNACMSKVGRQGGQQNISIGPGCERRGVVVHEILHALGRWHEQSRPDRDNHVKVNTENIVQGKQSNFQIVSDAMTQDIAYDLGSIMHYDAYAFTSNNEPTIQPRDPNIPLTRIGQRDNLSEQDIKHIQELYCEDVDDGWGPWSEWSQCSSSCGSGTRQRSRNCLEGNTCQGQSITTETCNNGDCPQGSGWSEWSSWSDCSLTCGEGQRIRIRTCMLAGGGCEGEDLQKESCSNQPCSGVWSDWSAWSNCSCDTGVITRTRYCLTDNCSGPSSEEAQCTTDTCTGTEPVMSSSPQNYPSTFLALLTLLLSFLLIHW